jgi:hypothetical protein
MAGIAQAAVVDLGWPEPAPAVREWVPTVADFPRFDFSMHEVRHAGELIAGSPSRGPETLHAFKVANNWRDSHAYPMRSVRHQLVWYMRLLGIAGVTGARLKRMQAIRRKLQRLGLNLNQLQDLGGCRAIVPRISNVGTLAAALREKSRHDLRGSGNDYISSPKRDGYRSHHLIFTYHGLGEAAGYTGRRIEVQIRTQLQHSWATAVEAVGLIRGEYLKGNQGSEDWLRFFKLVSAEFALAEGCPEPPDVPARSERLQEIRVLDKRLEASATLENLSHIVRWSEMPGQKKVRPTYYLIVYDNATNEVGVEPHFAPKSAMSQYEIAELNDRKVGGDTANIVLVEADKMDLVREAYPNYFGDVQLFKKQLKNIVQGEGARDFVVKPQELVKPPDRDNVDFWWLRRRISSGLHRIWGFTKP